MWLGLGFDEGVRVEGSGLRTEELTLGVSRLTRIPLVGTVRTSLLASSRTSCLALLP